MKRDDAIIQNSASFHILSPSLLKHIWILTSSNINKYVFCSGNHFEIVQMLLEHKPNVNALDKDGYTALAIACKEGYYDIALALINSGAYINVQVNLVPNLRS